MASSLASAIGAARAAPSIRDNRGIEYAKKRASISRRRVLSRAKRDIPDDVGFNYDEFDDFGNTESGASTRSGDATDAKKGGKKAGSQDEDGSEFRWAEVEPPPDPPPGKIPGIGVELPDALSYFSPLVRNRIPEAEALELQRAWARAVFEEEGELPSRRGNLITDPDTGEAREMTKKEHAALLDDYFTELARREKTYPQVLAREPAYDPYRLLEKFGRRPQIEKGNTMTYPVLMENLFSGNVSRLLQYDEGRTIIVELIGAGNELAGPKRAKQSRYECKVPGDVHWDITKMCYMNRYGAVNKTVPERSRTTLSQFMHVDQPNEAFNNMTPYIYPFMLMWVACGLFTSDGAQNVRRGRKQRWEETTVFKMINKYLFRGRLKKKAVKKDMMEEFGKSKAKMIGQDKDKTGSFQGLTFDDVAGVDHIVDEFKYYISVMKEFKEWQQEDMAKRGGSGKWSDLPKKGRMKYIMSEFQRIPKPGDPIFMVDPDFTYEVEDDNLSAERAKLSIPKGVLFEGPPGTGKTLLAKAVAGEAGVPFFYANGSEFVEMFVGVAAKRVRDLFRRARDVSPSIIFIDELDTIGRSRSLYSNRDSATLEREAGLLQLLVELDGFETKSSAGSKQEMVLVMGATNLSAQLDPALLRSGRFERSFNINVPSTHKDRLAILKVHARKLNIPRGGNEKWDEDALLNRTTELTHGYSGASLAALLNEASILSVRANREFVNIEDIERVLERNLVGVASAPMEDGWGKDHLAMVEAGRAVLWSSKSSKQYCPTVLRVTIKPHGTKTTGVMLQQETTEHQWTEDDARTTSLDEYIDGLAMLLAGRCVETVFFGPQGVSVQTKGDLVAAVDIAYDIATSSGVYPDSKKGLRPYWPEELIEHFRLPAAEMDAGVHDLMMRAHIRAEEYVQYYKPVILQVASELLAHESLYGTHIKDLVNEHEVKMAVAKDESLAKAQAKKEDAENRKRKDKEFEDETNERRRAASAEKTEQVESRGVAGAIDVDSSDEPLSSDPFGTSETAGVVDDNFKGVLGRAMRSVGRRGGAFPESERKPEDEDEDADAKK